MLKVKTFSEEQNANFLHYYYIERKRDSDNNIIPFLSSNNIKVTSESPILLPTGEEVKADPIIALLHAPNRSFPFNAYQPNVFFKTAVFLHPRLFENYILKGTNKPDKVYAFRPHKDGLEIADVTTSKLVEFTIKDLKQLGIVSVEWDYLMKTEKWFESSCKTPTGCKVSGYFLNDIGKIPTKLINGNVVRNSDVWAMS